MRHRAFVVFDTKAKAYLPPFFMGEVGMATRSFTDAVNGDGPFSKHPEDYTLFEIGNFDDNTGMLEPYKGPELVVTALQVLAEPSYSEEQLPLLTKVGGTD